MAVHTQSCLASIRSTTSGLRTIISQAAITAFSARRAPCVLRTPTAPSRPGASSRSFFPAGRQFYQYNPILVGSQGTNIRTNALFVNDNVRWNEHLTFNFGLRWDKNNAVDSAGCGGDENRQTGTAGRSDLGSEGGRRLGPLAAATDATQRRSRRATAIANMASAGGDERATIQSVSRAARSMPTSPLRLLAW